MTSRKLLVIIAILIVGSVTYYLMTLPRAQDEVLTGVVDANEVVVSAQITGRIERLLVDDGAHVRAGQLIAVLAPSELQATAQAQQAAALSAAAKAQQARADWSLAASSLPARLTQAKAQLAAAQADLNSGQAHLAQAQGDFDRDHALLAEQLLTPQDFDAARATRDMAAAAVASDRKNVAAAAAAVADAEAQMQQVASDHSALVAAQRAAAQASQNWAVARVQLGYTQIVAPIDGVVGVRVARQGEVVAPASPIITLIDLTDTWVQAEMPETYADRIRLGQALTVRLPSGALITGHVDYKAAEADFATERDVSRYKRDIRTVQFRVAVPNPGEELALGTTAFVVLPFRAGGGA